MLEEKQILNDQSVRDSLIEKVEVIDKVGKLAMLPGCTISTKAQVADFYGVGLTAISSLIHDNKEEMIKSGYKAMKGQEIVSTMNNIEIESKRGFIVVGKDIKLARGDNGVFDRKAVLRVGMLLRESEVAKKIRDYLLEVEDKASEKTKTEILESIAEVEDNMIKTIVKPEPTVVVKEAVVEEKLVENPKDKYVAALTNAIDSNDTVKIMNAFNNLIKFLLKQEQDALKQSKAEQKRLTTLNQNLSDKVSVMESRGCTITDSRRAIVEIMKAIVKKNYGEHPDAEDYEDAWNKFYDFAKVSTGIDVRARDEKSPRRTLIDHVAEDEMKILEGFARCYAMRSGVQPQYILDLNIRLEK